MVLTHGEVDGVALGGDEASSDKERNDGELGEHDDEVERDDEVAVGMSVNQSVHRPL